MVTSDPHGEHRGLVRELRVQLVAAEAGLGSMQSGVEQPDAGRFGQHGVVDPGDGFGDDERLGQGEIPHSARRSRISLSRSVIRRR